MAVLNSNAEGVVTLSAADVTTDVMMIDSIILHGTAAGAFVFKLGNAAFTINNTATGLSVQLTLNRQVVGATLTSGPVGATMYILLKKRG